MKKESLYVGVNLGGWISQYHAFDYEHFDRFIVEKDIQQIASWGMDHVRLPVDYPVIEDQDHPGTINERGFAYVENCLNWCEKAGIRLVLDLHKAPGYTFTNTLEAGPLEPNTLFSDPAMQERFISLWEAITKRYTGQAQDTLAVELLNEMVLPDSQPWNALAQASIDRIRAIDPDRLIVIGGNNYNAVDEMQHIKVQPDPNLLITFHFYLPMTVTHQRAPWVKEMDLYGGVVHYPGMAEGLGEFIDQYPQYREKYAGDIERFMDQTYVRELLKPAFDYIKATGNHIYCGEFGVIDHAPLMTRINWTRDFITLLNKYNIGRAIWSYKQMDFALVDAESKVVSEELIKAAVGS